MNGLGWFVLSLWFFMGGLWACLFMFRSMAEGFGNAFALGAFALVSQFLAVGCIWRVYSVNNIPFPLW
jgi:DMSO reductase anchor subunit